MTAGGLLRLDRAAINAEAKLDGKYLLAPSDPSRTAEDVALGYKQLAEAEAGSRERKHTLDLRPVYHRLEARIRAHVTLCWPPASLRPAPARRGATSMRNSSRCTSARSPPPPSPGGPSSGGPESGRPPAEPPP